MIMNEKVVLPIWYNVTKEEVERALMEIEYEQESDDNDAEDALKK